MIPWHEHLAAIEAIVAALEISPTSVRLGGRRLEAAALADRPAALRRLLYEEAFIKGIEEREPPREDADTDAFVAQLSASNAAHGRISAGWRLVELTRDGYAVVEKHGQRYRVARELVDARDGLADIRAPKEDASSSDVFYYAYGDALPLGGIPAQLTRFYLNASATAAPGIVGALTRRLDAERIPYKLKCFRDPHEYYRRDGLLVYADARFSAAATRAVLEAVAGLPSAVRAPTPIFTRRLAAGVASAPDPGAESYGERCCRILAAAILECPDRSASRLAHAAATMDRAEERGRRQTGGGDPVSRRSKISGPDVARGAGR